MNCHICNHPVANLRFRCNLDCDGKIQPICDACAAIWRRFIEASDEYAAEKILLELQVAHDQGKK